MGKSKKRRHRRFRLSVFFIILLLLILLALLAYRGCTLEKAEVEGTKLYPEETIRQWVLNDDYSWNTLYVYLKYKFKEAEEMPFLQEPVVTMKSPHILHIQVKEKDILGYLYIPAVGQNAYFDKDGIVVETSSEKKEEIMEVTGLECKKAKLHEKIPMKDKSMLKSMLELTKGLKSYKMLPDAVHYDEFSNIVLKYDQVSVNFGTTRDMKAKLETLSVIFPEVKGMSGTIHMENWSEDNTDVPFEKKKDA